MADIFATGLQMGESARWHDGRFWMCDWLAGTVLSFSDSGEATVEARFEGMPASIDWRPSGELVVTTELGEYNELVVDQWGNCWVDMPGAMPWEPPAPGTVSVVRPDGTARVVAEDVWFPNGMAIVDETTLVVAESHADRLTAWTISASGEVSDRRVWAALDPGSAPDGICVDASGAIWFASVPLQACVRVAEGGEVLETVPVDRGAFSCCLGGEDGRTLFVVANHYSEQGASDGVVFTHRVDVPSLSV